jgi:hypothetical protein
MSVRSHELLREALSDTFDDGSGARRLVPVFGAGLHRHLRDHAGAFRESDEWKRFCDWNSLLEHAARADGVTLRQHADPTATWEEYVASLDKTKNATQVESVALASVAQQLKALPPGVNLQIPQLRAAFSEAKFRDVVTLNFDNVLPSALAGVSGSRLWHAHGNVEQPHEMQLGMRRYGDGAKRALDAWVAYKDPVETPWRQAAGGLPKEGSEPLPAWTRDLRRAWEAELRTTGQPSAWTDAFYTSDVAFIGCALDRAEFDVWWVLNQRRRNFHRAPLDARPRTFVLTVQECAADHLTTEPAGIMLVPFNSWDDAWEALIGRWWERGST